MKDKDYVFFNRIAQFLVHLLYNCLGYPCSQITVLSLNYVLNMVNTYYLTFENYISGPLKKTIPLIFQLYLSSTYLKKKNYCNNKNV